jgi:hypothetical protein
MRWPVREALGFTGNSRDHGLSRAVMMIVGLPANRISERICV